VRVGEAELHRLRLNDLPLAWQAWESWYLLSKARRLRETAATLNQKQPATTTASGSSQVPAYMTQRVVGQGAALPEVEVGGVEVGEGQKRGGVEDEPNLLRQAVVRHVVEGLRGELVRELVEMREL
jgi:hypothetical protein